MKSLLPSRHAHAARAVMLAGMLLAIIFPNALAAQAAKPSQYDVQAVYLYDFAKFVRWQPVASDKTLDMCVAGQSAYIDSLKKIVSGESIGGRPVVVKPVVSAEDEAGCDVLFIGMAARDQLDALLAASAGKPILTVSDIPGFLDHGGMIQFVVIDDRVRFSVSLDPIQRSNLSLNSELLKVAVSVKGKSHGGGAP